MKTELWIQVWKRKATDWTDVEQCQEFEELDQKHASLQGLKPWLRFRKVERTVTNKEIA